MAKAKGYDHPHSDHHSDPPAPTPHVPPAPPGPVQHETTDAEDIDALAADIVALVQLAEYDDMTWAEVDRAMRLASAQIRQNWSATGTVKAAQPEGEVLARREGESDEDHASRTRAIRARHASGLEPEPEPDSPRSRYAG
jgi:hypothetical protein